MSLFAKIVNNTITDLWLDPDSTMPLARGYTDMTSAAGAVVPGATLVSGTWVAPAPPPNPTLIDALVFLRRFTDPERDAFYAAAAANVAFQDFLTQVTAAQQIDLTDPTVIGGINALVTAGLLTQARATVILTP